MRFWARFFTSSIDDYRPVIVDMQNIPYWWNTGYGGDDVDSYAVICSVVDTKDESSCLELIQQGWPEVESMDFCNRRADDWMPPQDRFPPD